MGITAQASRLRLPATKNDEQGGNDLALGRATWAVHGARDPRARQPTACRTSG